MFYVPSRTRLDEMTRLLVETAMGREKADLVVRNASLVNVNSGEIIAKQDIAVKRDRIALVGNAQATIGPSSVVVDANERYVVPGFIDGHVHIESAMVTATEFARAVLPHGTTTVFIDPHEIANVLGMEGVRFFMREGRSLPLKVLVTFPSCVPAAPGLETNGATFGPKEVEEALGWEGVVALGEMMNYPGVLAGDAQVHGEIAATLRAGRVVEGHAVNLLDGQLAAYAAAGITSCHESTKKAEAVEKLRYGMYAMLREASASRDVADTVRSITEDKLDARHACLVTDDREPNSLLQEGHIDHVVRRAIQEGVDPVKAIQMATLNVAEHYECARELGSIAPARYADMAILDNLDDVAVSTVIADGKIVFQSGKLVATFPRPNFSDSVKKSMRIKLLPKTDDLVIRTKAANGTVKARAIGVMPATIYTKNLEKEVPAKDGRASANPGEDVLKIAVFERHKATGNVGLGFVHGLGVKEGAVASTVGHDCHNLVVAGASDLDMIFAANALIESDGGLIAVKQRKVVAQVPLPIAGLMSDKSVEVVSEQIETLKEAWGQLGSTLPSPYITLAFTTLSVIPELRITDKGLLDAVNFKFVNPIVE
ncbi:MAG: adenine deaminase [Candidatus Bathyarchaeia archaeon]